MTQREQTNTQTRDREKDQAIARCQLLALVVVAKVFEVTDEQIRSWLARHSIPITTYQGREYVRRMDLFDEQGQCYYIAPALVQAVHDEAVTRGEGSPAEVLEIELPIGRALVEHSEATAAWAA